MPSRSLLEGPTQPWERINTWQRDVPAEPAERAPVHAGETDALVEMVFGSHLYGTAGPDSDRDYKGIYLPSLRAMLLGEVEKSSRCGEKVSAGPKNTAADSDREFYSLQYFVRLALEGQTVAIDMLHAPATALLSSSGCWEDLVANRRYLYSRNLKSLFGYARRQAAKYGVKGSRLRDARTVLEILETSDPEARLASIWERLPVLEHARFGSSEGGIGRYDVCGRTLQSTARIGHYLATLRGFVEEYGHRARLAEQNKDVDWKSVSHAFRAGYQARHILADGGFEYPLPETTWLIQVKRGEVPFAEAGPALDALISEVEALSAKSQLPEEPDAAWWQDWTVGWLRRLHGIEVPA